MIEKNFCLSTFFVIKYFRSYKNHPLPPSKRSPPPLGEPSKKCHFMSLHEVNAVTDVDQQTNRESRTHQWRSITFRETGPSNGNGPFQDFLWGGWGVEDILFWKPPRIFRFIILPLEILEKTNFHPWKFYKIVWCPIKFPRSKPKIHGNSKSCSWTPLEFPLLF